MSRVIGQCSFRQQPALKLRRRFKTLALAASLALPLLAAYSRTAPVSAQQEPPGANAQAYAPIATADGARHSDLSSLDSPLLIRDSDRLGAAMHLRLPEYTYLQTRLSRELDQRGKLLERVSAYEAYPITVLGRHRHVISLVSENGAQISKKRLKQERLRADGQDKASASRTAVEEQPARDGERER